MLASACEGSAAMRIRSSAALFVAIISCAPVAPL
jgi:hypothetical protein